jgi:hypothetical protein
MENSRTGLDLRGQLRDIAIIKNNNKKYFLFLQNDQLPLLYKMNGGSKKE